MRPSRSALPPATCRRAKMVTLRNRTRKCSAERSCGASSHQLCDYEPLRLSRLDLFKYDAERRLESHCYVRAQGPACGRERNVTIVFTHMTDAHAVFFRLDKYMLMFQETLKAGSFPLVAYCHGRIRNRMAIYRAALFA
eukprot:2851352-Rhodomonas_salina.4